MEVNQTVNHLSSSNLIGNLFHHCKNEKLSSFAVIYLTNIEPILLTQALIITRIYFVVLILTKIQIV